jgi:hypothetical protein
MKTTVEKKNQIAKVMNIKPLVFCQWASCFGVAIVLPLCLFDLTLVELYLLVKMKFFQKFNISLQFDQKNMVKQVIGVFKDFLINPAKKIFLGEKKIKNFEDLRNFISNKSAFVSQFTLYGYLRTRMGGITFYKSLNDLPFETSVNIARWNIYLVSVQDLLLFTFSYIYNKQDRNIIAHAGSFFKKILEEQLPFGLEIELKNKSIQEFDERVKKVNWHMSYKQKPFEKSCEALFSWSPIADELKDLDKEIVINSMDVQWQNIMIDFVKLLKPLDANVR